MDRNFPIKGRYIAVIWIAPFIYLPGLDWVLSWIDPHADWYWYDIAYYFYFYGLFASVLIGLVFIHRVDWRAMLSAPDRKDYAPAFKLTAFVFIFSIAAAYVVFYPLSFVTPAFVHAWFIDLPPLIYSNDMGYPLIPNLLGLICLAVLPPLIEEFAFRGVLLHRWSMKWGTGRAVFWSSFLFAVIHPDPLGAFAFGLAMSAVYLRTQTLVLPMLCHALNNFAVWLIEAGYFAFEGKDYRYTMDDFQAGWPWGIACGLICIVWAYLYLNSNVGQKVWKLPSLR